MRRTYTDALRRALAELDKVDDESPAEWEDIVRFGNAKREIVRALESWGERKP